MTQIEDTAVIYLARGADKGWAKSIQNFVWSYRKYPAGRPHRLYVVYKGFQTHAGMVKAEQLFSGLDVTPIRIADAGFDIGAYVIAAHEVPEPRVCFLNTHSEILATRWLEKLSRALDAPGVGLVGATGSFESPIWPGTKFPPFPNPHLRSNAMLIGRDLFREALDGIGIRDKVDAYLVESGPMSLTRQVMGRGLEVLVVDRNGRGYTPEGWPSSRTFRRSEQEGLLISDNQTRAYMQSIWDSKRHLARLTWGHYLRADRSHDLDEKCFRLSGGRG